MNIFAKASKLKLLFKTSKGNVTLQDLWDLPLTKIREMANELNRSLVKSEDLFTLGTAEDETNKLRLSIIVAVVNFRVEENESKIASEEKAQELKLVRNLIRDKKLEAKGNKSIEELEALEKELSSS